MNIWLFSYDPFEGWAKQFSGNWDAYVHCSVAWGHIGAACHDIGRNLVTGAADVSTVWRGNAAEGEQEYQLGLGNAAMQLKTACTQYNDLYNKAAELTKKLFEVVSGLMSQLLDVLIISDAAGAVGTASIETVIGPVIGYGVAAYYVYQAYKLYEEISKFFGTADDRLARVEHEGLNWDPRLAKIAISALEVLLTSSNWPSDVTTISTSWSYE